MILYIHIYIYLSDAHVYHIYCTWTFQQVPNDKGCRLSYLSMRTELAPWNLKPRDTAYDLSTCPETSKSNTKRLHPQKRGLYVYMSICIYVNIYIYNVYILKYIDACIHTLHYITLIHTYIHVRIPTPGNYIGQHQKTASTIQNQCFWGYAWNPTDIQMTFGGLTFSWLGYTDVYIICNISNSMYCIK